MHSKTMQLLTTEKQICENPDKHSSSRESQFIGTATKYKFSYG